MFEHGPKSSEGRNRVVWGRGNVLRCRRVNVKSGEDSVLGKWRKATGLKRSKSRKE